MNNEESERQAERSSRLDEARRREGMEALNRDQREEAARDALASDALASKKAYSRTLGSMGATAPIFVERATYERALQEREAMKKSNSVSVCRSSVSVSLIAGLNSSSSSVWAKLFNSRLVYAAIVILALTVSMSTVGASRFLTALGTSVTLGLACGAGIAVKLFKEAAVNSRSEVSRVCLFAAGIVMLVETAGVISLALRIQ
jgi:hypothetical protein